MLALGATGKEIRARGRDEIRGLSPHPFSCPQCHVLHDNYVLGQWLAII